MRIRTKKFLDSLEAYLKGFFQKKAQEENLEGIRLWHQGYGCAFSAESEYPAALLIVSRVTRSDPYFADFQVTVGIAITDDDIARLNEIGYKWFDILEDAFSADWSLGGACLDSRDLSVENDCIGNMFLIQALFTAEIDIGGYVYEEAEGESEGLQEVRIPDEENGAGDVSEMRKGVDSNINGESEYEASI